MSEVRLPFHHRGVIKSHDLKCTGGNRSRRECVASCYSVPYALTGSTSRDIVNFPSELCRRRSGMFAEVASLAPPGLTRLSPRQLLADGPQPEHPLELSCDIHTHTPAKTSSTNFILYLFALNNYYTTGVICAESHSPGTSTSGGPVATWRRTCWASSSSRRAAVALLILLP